jgi:hypothetical protein
MPDSGGARTHRRAVDRLIVGLLETGQAVQRAPERIGITPRAPSRP